MPFRRFKCPQKLPSTNERQVWVVSIPATRFLGETILKHSTQFLRGVPARLSPRCLKQKDPSLTEMSWIFSLPWLPFLPYPAPAHTNCPYPLINNLPLLSGEFWNATQMQRKVTSCWCTYSHNWRKRTAHSSSVPITNPQEGAKHREITAVHNTQAQLHRAAQGPCTVIGALKEVCVYPSLLTVNSLSTYSWVVGCTYQSVFLEWGSESVDKNGLCHRWNFSPKLCKASLQPHCPSLTFLLLEFVQMLNNVGACSPATGNRSVQLFSLSKRNQDKCISHL